MSDTTKYSADSWALFPVSNRNEMVVRVDVGKTFLFDEAPVRLARLAYVLHLQPEVLLSALLGSRFADNDKTLLAMWSARTGKPASAASLGDARRELARDAIEREPARKGAAHRRAKAYPYLDWEVPRSCTVVMPRSQGLHSMLFDLGAADLKVKRGRSGPLHTLELPPAGRPNDLDEEVEGAVKELERLCENARKGNARDQEVLAKNAEELALLGGMDALLGEMLRSTEAGRSRAKTIGASAVAEVRRLREALGTYREESRLHLADEPHIAFFEKERLGGPAAALLTWLRGGLPSRPGEHPLMDRVLRTPEQVSVALWHQLHDVLRYAALLLLDSVKAAEATEELFLPLLTTAADAFVPAGDELPDELKDAWPTVLSKYKQAAPDGPFKAALEQVKGANELYGQLLSGTELVTRVAKLSAPAVMGRLCEVGGAASKWPGGASSSLYFRLAATVGRLTPSERKLVYEALADSDIRKTMNELHDARFVKLKTFGAGLSSLLTLATVAHGLATDLKGTLQQLQLCATVDSVYSGIDAVLEALGRGDSIAPELKLGFKAIGVIAGVIGVIEAEKAINERLKAEDHTGAWFERSKQVLASVSILMTFCAASPAAPVVGAVVFLAGIVIAHLEAEKKEAMGGAAHVFWDLLLRFERPYPAPKEGEEPGRAIRVLDWKGEEKLSTTPMRLARKEVKRLYWLTTWWELDLKESSGRLANAGLPKDAIERVCAGDAVLPTESRVWKHGDEVLTVHAPHLQAKVVDSRPFKDEWKYVIYVEETEATVGGHDEDDLAPRFEDGRKVKVDWTDGKTYTARVHRLDRERHAYVVQWKVASDEDEEKWLAVNEDDVIVLKEARKKMRPV